MTTADGPAPEGGGILAAVDGSESADRALAWAVREARARDVALTIAHAYYWPGVGFGDMQAAGSLMDALEVDSAELLQTAAKTAGELEPQVPISTVSKLGPVVPTLVELSRDRELVVVGSRGLGGFTGLLLGSVGTGLVANALCSVAVVRGERVPAPDDPVVVGMDGRTGDEVLTEAFQAARRRNCPLLAVHAWQDPSADVRLARGRGTFAEQESWQRTISEAVSERVTHVGARFPTVRADSVAVRGRPAAVLLEQAATAQLVIVGSRGRSEFKGVLLGSTGRAMVQHAPCPVLVVRSQEDSS